MNRLVNELILLAKSERTDFLRLEVFDLDLFTSDVFTKIQALTGETRLWSFHGVAEGYCNGDRHRLTQAVMNLAQNAVQHTQAGDRITLGVAVKDQQFHVWLKDTGTGIDPQEQDRIFERFARVRYTQRRSEGSGLGLAIVKRIVEAHQGSVQIQSELGTGSTFTLIIPLMPSRVELKGTLR